MFTQQFFVEGLGCASYLVGCEAKGIAAVIDPDRDVQKYLETAQGRGLKITHIMPTTFRGIPSLSHAPVRKFICTKTAAQNSHIRY